MNDFLSFKLDPAFVSSYVDQPVNFGFNGVGEIAYLRTYSRNKPDGVKEQWHETVERVVNGTFSIQKDHINNEGLEWKEHKGQRLAKRMYDAIFNMRFLPPGRGLFAMGSEAVHVKGLAAALQNCGFTSTEFIDKNPSEPFTFMLDASACGVGVGFDTKGAGKITILEPASDQAFVIPDSREGWVESIKLLIEAYALGNPRPIFDYTLIRPAGVPLKTFGGVSSGPQPLIEMHQRVETILRNSIGKKITVTNIADIMNLIGRCIVAGGIRRTAQIMFGEIDDEEYLNLKNYDLNPERESWGWASNNSVYAPLGADYSRAAKQAATNGEPGFCFMENVNNYARMNGVIDRRDKAIGFNPCSEQPLEHMELCTLVETFPFNCKNLDEYLETLEMAYLYAKTVTLLKTHWPKTNRVMKRNRRIGTGMSGIVQFIEGRGTQEFINWCEAGYAYILKQDHRYSNWFGIKESIRMTTIKPSGTVSLLAGATPGVHYMPAGRFHIRRIRIPNTSDMIAPLKAAGYTVLPAAEDSVYTSVVEIPVDAKASKSSDKVSMWEQLAIAALVQKHWSDNGVSVSVYFDEHEAKDIKQALDYYQYQLKSVSFFPRLKGVYKQAPYEEISEETYLEMLAKLRIVDWKGTTTQAVSEKFCDGDKCAV